MSISTRREKEKERRREDILQAAQQVFLRSGYQGATMDEVAQEAELSKGTLYLYFKSKFEIYVELSNRACNETLRGFVEIAAGTGTGREMVGQMLSHWVKVSSSDLKQFRIAVGFIASDDRPADCDAVECHHDTIANTIRQMAGAVVRGQEDGSVAKGLDPVTTASQLWSAMMGTMLFYSRSSVLMEKMPFTIESDNFMSNQIDLLCRGLRAS
ncbi:MAG: TetR/AcrR family transcriptional regulator [Kofleriaceae bacterium]|nr:TetR/AcrR family transcriptional regulator [Kofleriaceae bacterium]